MFNLINQVKCPESFNKCLCLNFDNVNDGEAWSKTHKDKINVNDNDKDKDKDKDKSMIKSITMIRSIKMIK